MAWSCTRLLAAQPLRATLSQPLVVLSIGAAQRPSTCMRLHTSIECSCVCCLQVPIQLISAAVMLSSASWAEAKLEAADVISITALFALLVLLAATQVRSRRHAIMSAAYGLADPAQHEWHNVGSWLCLVVRRSGRLERR